MGRSEILTGGAWYWGKFTHNPTTRSWRVDTKLFLSSALKSSRNRSRRCSEHFAAVAWCYATPVCGALAPVSKHFVFQLITSHTLHQTPTWPDQSSLNSEAVAGKRNKT